MSESTLDPRCNRMVKVEMTEAEALALVTCAEVGYEGAEDNLSPEEYGRARGALRRLKAAIEPSACPTYEVFNAQGLAVQVTVPENEVDEEYLEARRVAEDVDHERVVVTRKEEE